MSKRNLLPVRRMLLSTLCVVTLAATTSYVPAQPYAPGGPQNQPGALPSLDGLGSFPPPTQPGLGAAPAGLPGLDIGGTGTPGATANVSDPPALIGSLGLLTEVAGANAGTTTGAGTGFTEAFVFLYRDDPDMGIVREAYTQDEAKEQMEKEFGRLAALRAEPPPGENGGPGGGRSGPRAPQGPGGAADRATVEWDFYFEQLQMYDEFVKKKLLPGVVDLPGPTYDTADLLSGILTERTSLRDEYRKATVALQTRLTQENTAFYERLDGREDRRRNYLEWIDEKKEELAAWAEAWQSNSEAQNFRAGNAVNRDSWYAKTNYGNPNPMVTQANGRTAVITKYPVETEGEVVNIVSGNLTPYDLLDNFGRPRQPVTRTTRSSAPTSGMVLLDAPQQ